MAPADVFETTSWPAFESLLSPDQATHYMRKWLTQATLWMEYDSKSLARVTLAISNAIGFASL